jgi:ubiquitin fusion degradation protein 1
VLQCSFNATWQSPPAFSGTGNALSGRSNTVQGSSTSAKGKSKASESTSADSHSWGSSGQTLGRRTLPQNGPIGLGGSGVPQTPHRNKKVAKQRSSTPEDWGVDDDDVIMIDSD